MPDLLSHFGAGYLVSRWSVRRSDVPLILGGSLLPDVGWIARRALHGLFSTDSIALSVWLIPWHTPWVLLLGCATLALICRTPVRAFSILYGVSWVHLLLDASQTRFGNGVLFLYPLSMRETSWHLFWPESPVNHALAIGSFILLLGLLFGLVDGPLTVGWAPSRASEGGQPSRRRRLFLSLIFVLAAVATVSLTRARLVEENVFNLRFVTDPSAFEGRRIALDRSLVVGDAPPRLRTFNGRQFLLTGDLDVNPGDTISLEGTYGGGRIAVQRYHKHQEELRSLYSLVGLTMYGGLEVARRIAAKWKI